MKMRENTGICISGIRPFCGGVNLQNWASSWFLLNEYGASDVSVENKFSKKPHHSTSGMRPGAPSLFFQKISKTPCLAQSGRKLSNTKKIGNFLRAESPSPLSVSTVVRANFLAALYISPVQIFWQLSFSKNQGQGQVFRNSPATR